MKLDEIAREINKALKAWEADPTINVVKPANGHKWLWWSNAISTGRQVGVQYISYQGRSYLNKTRAMKYLEWIRAGNVGRHFEMEKEL